MMVDLMLEDCIRYLVQGHYVYQHSFNDGESVNSHYNYRITGVTEGHVDGFIPYPFDRCAFVSLRYKDCQCDNFTLYALNPAEYNPHKPIEESVAYGMQSVNFFLAELMLDNMSRLLIHDAFALIDVQPLISLIDSKLQELHTAQAQARAAYLAG